MYTAKFQEVKKVTEALVKIADLQPNMRELSFYAKVLELGEVRDITKRDTGEEHKVRDVLIGDETGTVLYSAWNEHIDEIEEGNTYFFDNVKTILYQRNIRVSLGRMGHVENTDHVIEEVNEENNISTKEYEYQRRDYGRRDYGGRRNYGYRQRRY